MALVEGQSLAHLYLADELDREGRAAEAAAHYNSFLEMIARQHGQDRPSPERLIAIVFLRGCRKGSSILRCTNQSLHLTVKASRASE